MRSRLYRVTKSHTRGLLAGMVTEEVTPVHFFAGHVVKNAIGGGDYRVIIVEDLGERTVQGLCYARHIYDQQQAQRSPIVPTHAPTTAAEHSAYPKGRW